MSETSVDIALDRTPDVYLRDGYRDATGATRPDLLDAEALNAASQLGLAELAPQEMAFTYEALQALLPLHEGAAPERFNAALGEALATVGRMIRQPNNEGLASWCRGCASHIREEADIPAFFDHMLAVLRLYTLFVDMPAAGGDSSPASSAPS